MFLSNGNKIALVTDDEKDFYEIRQAYDKIKYKTDWYRSDCHEKLAKICDKYEIILIEFRLGGGLLSVEIAKFILKHGFNGKIFFLAGGSMEVYSQRYGTLLMKDSVLADPELVFNIEMDVIDQICDTTFITQKVTKGGF